VIWEFLFSLKTLEEAQKTLSIRRMFYKKNEAWRLRSYKEGKANLQILLSSFIHKD